MKDEEMVITDNDFLRQFETTIQGELVKVEYSQQDRKIFLTKLVITEELKEKGFMEPFLEKLLDYIKERGNDRVVPTNPDIAKFMRKNKRKYKDLLPVGINI
ncbi:N-acetyltransferase [Gillisia sp. M10.2A]|uniref:N-acetyltransferase n=1 Tax=Gillisia lutea TaxID=2909668 RepID=A0ABS9EK07_9FLAO|nr:N-acetyltransferase [Gillisia lutea]MCF4101791.1 N-acetyltransferase [Gillisia lutea]